MPSTEATDDRITKVKVGRVLTLHHGPDREATDYTVTTCPDGCNAPGAWMCATHPELGAFRNQLEKDWHIHAGRHALVWICFEHGPVVP